MVPFVVLVGLIQRPHAAGNVLELLAGAVLLDLRKEQLPVWLRFRLERPLWVSVSACSESFSLTMSCVLTVSQVV